MSLKSLAPVTVQLASIGYLLLSGPIFTRPNRWFWSGMEIAGLALVACAVSTMKLRYLRVAPEVASGARLVTSGPYRFLRHPMYLAVILVCGALVGNQAGWLRFLVFGVLVVTLVVKMHYEERLLTERFPEYHDYQRRTSRLIPFIY